MPLLMIPGPTDLSPGVRQALAQPMVAHYGDAWVELYAEVIENLKQVFGTRHEVFALTGSGTAGMESGLNSALDPGDKLLVLRNGAFAARYIEPAQAHRIEVVVRDFEWGTPVDASAIDQACAQHPDLRAVALTHNETSTGVLNPLDEIAEACRARGLLLFVDAVSSIGAVQMRFDEWGLGVCAGASQKALAAPPGISPVAVGPPAWEAMRSRKDAARSWYLDLLVWQRYAIEWADWHPFPVTTAVSTVVALRQSLREILHEGLAPRYERHAAVAARLREGLADLGFRSFAQPGYESPTVTVALAPEGLDPVELNDFLLRDKDIMIAFAHDRERAIRVGHMGVNACDEKVDLLLEAIREFMR